MLYWLADLWVQHGGPGLFLYVPTRSLLGFLTSFVLSLMIGRRVIRMLFNWGYVDYPRDYGDLSSGDKKGTPTAGGLLILITSGVSVLLICDLSNPRVWLVLLAMILFSYLGHFDDKSKKLNKSADGGASRITKLIPQFFFGVLLGSLLLPWSGLFPPISDPDKAMKLKESLFMLDHGAFYIPFFQAPLVVISELNPFGESFEQTWFFLVASGVGVCWSILMSNAVNYTDGLDGLLSIPALFCFVVLGVFSYIHGTEIFADRLIFPYIDGVNELTIICAIFMGSCLGFAWYNVFPADVFMGDTGSLMLGGVMLTIAWLIREEMILVLAGAIFLVEFFSSAFQDYYFFRRKGKRVFREAPLHRSFVNSLKIAEPKVVARYWMFAAVLATIALMTIKIR